MSLLPIVHGGVSVGAFTEATGGTITTDGNFKVHTFNSSGTFEITKLGADAVVEYLVIAGGGSGGGYYYGGGGGAGGYRTATNFSVAQQAYSITVGAGGAGTSGPASGNNYVRGNNGSDSVFSSITSDGGGGGGTEDSSGNPAGSNHGKDGGSGGGAGGCCSNMTTPGQGTVGQGNDGGTSNTAGFSPVAVVQVQLVEMQQAAVTAMAVRVWLAQSLAHQ
jgi:hypothetical protein